MKTSRASRSPCAGDVLHGRQQAPRRQLGRRAKTRPSTLANFTGRPTANASTTRSTSSGRGGSLTSSGISFFKFQGLLTADNDQSV
jgi:hypothetical protein